MQAAKKPRKRMAMKSQKSRFSQLIENRIFFLARSGSKSGEHGK